jgi:hypothetical protein
MAKDARLGNHEAALLALFRAIATGDRSTIMHTLQIGRRVREVGLDSRIARTRLIALRPLPSLPSYHSARVARGPSLLHGRRLPRTFVREEPALAFEAAAVAGE